MFKPAAIFILACWWILIFALWVRHRAPHAREVRRGRRWSLGLLLQTLGIGALFLGRRPAELNAALGCAAMALALASLGLMLAAQRALGRQFAYQARLVESHELVVKGPYRLVRHPIYTGLFGLSLATGLVSSHWALLPVFAVLYFIGTAIRVRSEESLLREAFGSQYAAYAGRVPALIPFPRLK